MSRKLPMSVAPETFAVSGAHDPFLSVGAINPPHYASSTFVARSAKTLAGSFVQAYGLDNGCPRQPDELIYARVVHPNGQILEERWSKFEHAEQSALFSSGMSAITTTLLTFCRPGDQVLYSAPVYGGSDFFMKNRLPSLGINTNSFLVTDTIEQIRALLRRVVLSGPVSVVYVETPANPTLALADLPAIVAECAKHNPRPLVIVDSTVLGPIFHHPLDLGADIVVHSATKSIGGHSDLIAGIASGSNRLVSQIKATRTIHGTIADPHTAWLLLRSLTSYKVRVEATGHKALKVAKMLRSHRAIKQLYFPGLTGDREQKRRYKAQFTGHGSLMSFTVHGGRDEAYRVLDAFRVIKLAVSLGGVESLAEHPRTHTHSDVAIADLDRFGITEGMIRLSVGLEDADDVIADLLEALNRLS